MDKMSCGILVDSNRCLQIFEPNESSTIVDWKNVSEVLKKEFFKQWEDCINLERINLEKDSDNNEGVNQLCVLDTMEYLINQGKIGIEMSYEQAYDFSLDFMMEHMNEQ